MKDTFPLLFTCSSHWDVDVVVDFSNSSLLTHLLLVRDLIGYGGRLERIVFDSCSFYYVLTERPERCFGRVFEAAPWVSCFCLDGGLGEDSYL